MPNIAELQASIKIKTEEAQKNINNLNKQLEILNNKVKAGQILTKEEEKQRRQLISVLNQENKIKKQLATEEIKLQKLIQQAKERTGLANQKIDERTNNLSKKSAKESADVFIKQEKLIQQAKERTNAYINKESYSKQIKSAKESANVFIKAEKDKELVLKKMNKAHEEAIKINDRMNKQQQGLNKANTDSTGIWSKLSSRITAAGLAVNVITGLFNSLKQSVSEASQEAINFEKQMSMVNTLSNVSKTELNKMSQELVGMSKNMGIAPVEMAKGMYAVKSITDDTVDSMKVLETET